MACVTRGVDIFLRQWEYFFAYGIEVLEEPVMLDNLSPGPAAWNRWDVNQLNPAQCRVAARHASEDVCWERTKTATLLIGALAATTIGVAFCLITAGCVTLVAAEIFFALLELSAGILLLEGAIYTTMALAGTYLLSNCLAGIAFGVTVVWTKVVIPAMNKSSTYRQHLFDSEALLTRKAEGLANQA